MDKLLESVTQSPELFPYAFDVGSDQVTLIRLTRADYENASFLDARILTPKTPSRAIPWPVLAKSVDAAQLREHCRFIFHIGHVGSTLLSRLLGAHPQVFALREPLVLRTFANPHAMIGGGGDFADRLTGMLKLLSRTFDANQTSVVKATSFVSELAAGLMSRTFALPAVALYVSAESYMATILGGPNSRQEAKILAPSRIDRLHRRVGQEWRVPPLSEGEILALSWACEMSALAEAVAASRERILQIDFDRFLQDPSALSDVFRHFGIAVSDGEVRAILAGPDMRRYSKAPQFAYDLGLRTAVLNEARAVHAAEIHRGLAWLDRAASQWPVVGRAMTLKAMRPG